MSAKFHAIGTMTLDLDGIRGVIYGDVVEGTVKEGMSITIPFSSALNMTAVIEAIEFLDNVSEKISHIALVIDPEGDPEESAELITSLGIEDEVLEIS